MQAEGNPKQRRLLVIDDEADICEIIAEVAEYMGFDVKSVSEAEMFEEAFRDHQPDVVVLDLNMPGTDGIEWLRYLAEQDASVAVLIMSGLDSRTLSSAERLGKTHGLEMLGYLQKPIHIPALEESLSRFSEDCT